MSAEEETRELASEALPRISPELALVDSTMADGLRRRAEIVSRRRPVPFRVLHLDSETDTAPRFTSDDHDPPGAA